VFGILIGISRLKYQRIELIFDAFMALILDEFTFKGAEILIIRSTEDNHVADPKQKTHTRLTEGFERYKRAKEEYAKRYDVDFNEKYGEEEGDVEIEFDPDYHW